MIFGIGLKQFAKLEVQGDSVKVNFWTSYLLKRTSKYKFKVRNINDLSLSDFVDLERYFKEGNYYEFCRIFVIKRFWQTVYIHNMDYIASEFGKQKNELIELNNYIFDPPQYGEPIEVTNGSELRKEFVEEYGNYVVLTDVVCSRFNISFKEVEQWKLGDFMFWANYFTGQRILENVK